MEAEQDISVFRPWARENFVPADEAMDELSQKLSRYAIPGETELSFNKIFSKSYSWIDSLTNERSFVAFSDQKRIAHSFQQILDFLKEQRQAIKEMSTRRLRYNDAPWFLSFDIIPAYPPKSTDGQLIERAIGHSFGRDIKTVFSKAIGEFLERYTLTLYHNKNLLRASPSLLAAKRYSVLDLNLVAGFSEKQKKLYSQRRWNADSIFSWEVAERISTGERVYIPAQLVYWNYLLDDESNEPFLRERNTNGCGGFFTREGAILSGLYELIQRDAFLIYWLNTLPPPRIDPDSVPDEAFQDILKESKRYGFSVYCLNTTLDTEVPSFTVVIGDETGRGPRFSLGGGCQADPAKALRRALEEAWSVYYWVKPKKPYILPESYKSFADASIGQDERLRLWANPEMADRFGFFLRGRQHSFSAAVFNYPRRFYSEKDELNFLIRRVEGLGRGYEVYAYRARHPILSQLGYHAARVVVPQFVQLYLREVNIPLGANRLKQVPSKMGLKIAKELCVYPHPFP